MKKLMLIMAAALVSLSACSKTVDEPVARSVAQDDQVLTSLRLDIQGEREDVVIVNEEGRALDLKGRTSGSAGNLLSGVTFGQSGTVDGIICLYTRDPNVIGAGPNAANAIIRKVQFTQEGKRLHFRGELPNLSIKKGQLALLTMDVYVGGHIEGDVNTAGVGRGGGGVSYSYTSRAIRTQDGMDLSVLDPIFYSRGAKVYDGDDEDGVAYYSTTHKFKLLGEFVSLRFRLNYPGRTAQISGFAVRGFGRGGIILKAPSSDNGYTPRFEVKEPTATHRLGMYTPFENPKTRTTESFFINGDGTLPYESQAKPSDKKDIAYTLYLWTEVEPKGGIRVAHNSTTQNIVVGGSRRAPKPVSNYWGTSDIYPYQVQAKNFGKFSNLVLKSKPE